MRHLAHAMLLRQMPQVSVLPAKPHRTSAALVIENLTDAVLRRPVVCQALSLHLPPALWTQLDLSYDRLVLCCHVFLQLYFLPKSFTTLFATILVSFDDSCQFSGIAVVGKVDNEGFPGNELGSTLFADKRGQATFGFFVVSLNHVKLHVEVVTAKEFAV